jgi:hypothetical protein
MSKKPEKNEKLIDIRFEVISLRQWAKIGVQRSFTLSSLKSLLASKFDCNFEHLPLKAFHVVTNQGKLKKILVPTNQPIQ